MFLKTGDSPLVSYFDFILWPGGNCAGLEASLGSYMLNLNVRYVF